MIIENSICAVVVTYNRKELLLNCLQALQAQSYPVDHIVVVNNASTDGTVDFLRAKGWLDSDKFTLLTLDTNQGGAGGFYAGIEFAHQRQFDYIWLMDDDGFPSVACLEKLIIYSSEKSYIGPMVIDPQTQDKLSFALRIPNTIKVIDRYSEIPQEFKLSNTILNIVLPFNGTLISAHLIKKIGLVEKDYFIWGDEKEYTLRANKLGAEILTVVDAIFYHPKDSSSSTPMFFGKLRFNYANSKLKLYCFCRNSIATFRKHKSLANIFAFWVKTTWFFAFTKPSLRNLVFSWRAMWHGLIGDFSHHREYL
ncbi:glycosyltransferase family 2 protein [Actinobacillus equuli]|uniref:glycosyltransferase family 2 protein n=1 Tax=Actinobacillus equuli TaxID=718 RepID=UPI0024436FDC|nr:glycosyltransferase family 2 protein [Actinobacillus equuli]WGE42147.1 glycosyltransferase family 2 protein [Actinobacillus equuli subsp. haemolyticus]WGE50684.1 glycosyltransferase family 2 protein [Actinobacillus equuli subsp. haemolyticus]